MFQPHPVVVACLISVLISQHYRTKGIMWCKFLDFLVSDMHGDANDMRVIFIFREPLKFINCLINQKGKKYQDKIIMKQLKHLSFKYIIQRPKIPKSNTSQIKKSTKSENRTVGFLALSSSNSFLNLLNISL